VTCNTTASYYYGIILNLSSLLHWLSTWYLRTTQSCKCNIFIACLLDHHFFFMGLGGMRRVHLVTMGHLVECLLAEETKLLGGNMSQWHFTSPLSSCFHGYLQYFSATWDHHQVYMMICVNCFMVFYILWKFFCNLELHLNVRLINMEPIILWKTKINFIETIFIQSDVKGVPKYFMYISNTTNEYFALWNTFRCPRPCSWDGYRAKLIYGQQQTAVCIRGLIHIAR
jgi:hypothetical protein